jgi:hypothetical protein
VTSPEKKQDTAASPSLEAFITEKASETRLLPFQQMELLAPTAQKQRKRKGTGSISLGSYLLDEYHDDMVLQTTNKESSAR